MRRETIFTRKRDNTFRARDDFKETLKATHAHAIVQNLRVTEWENNIVRDICSNITKFVLRMDRELPFVALKEQRPMILVVRKNSFKDI